MTAGIAGSGPYSQLQDIRFQIKQLKRELDARPVGPRTRKRLESTLALLQIRLKAINAEIRATKQSRENGRGSQR